MTHNETIKMVEDSYINFMNLLKEKGYVCLSILGLKDAWENYVNEHYQFGKKQVFLLAGDYEDTLDFLQDKEDAIFFRQSFIHSKKKKNELLIPSSYGCVAGDFEMEICEITDKPKISFCGSKNSHPCRTPLFNILENSEKIACNFNYITVPCAGSIDPEIKQKTFDFNENTRSSEFVFCPRGNGNFSIRFYEALLCGRIPVVVLSDNELPFQRYIQWNKLCVLSENETSLVEDIISFHKNNDLVEVQKKCKETFKKYFVDDFDVLLLNEILYYEATLNSNIISIPKVFPDMEHNKVFDIKHSCYALFHQSYIFNLDLTKKFWLSRGSGQEGCLAFDVEILKKKKWLNGIVAGNCNFFVEGCGIYFENEKSGLEYSKRYMEAIQKVDLFGAMAKENSYPPGQQELLSDFVATKGIDITHSIGFLFSNEYFQNDKYEKILHQIFNNKKILVISSHKKSIEHQIPYLKYINPHLATASYQVVKAPDTSCGNHENTDWSIHLNKFFQELDSVHDFDIALVAAGGYSVLISEYIYEIKNKSVIYPGGNLQLWFGIMGNRWKSWWKYHKKGSEEYWIEPLEEDKPKNSHLVDGNGAYW
jgi:hypothetical protein